MTSNARPRRRMKPDERRRQLLAIGLRRLVERPIHDLSVDEVAAEAGISRGLLFHYFPTKHDYHAAVVAAAGRRVLRNVSPDPGRTGRDAVEQVVRRYVAQVERRRASYVALVHGRATVRGETDLAEDLRQGLAALVADLLGLDRAAASVVRGWVAYLEERALQWSAQPVGERDRAEVVVRHACAALDALLALDGAAPPRRP